MNTIEHIRATRDISREELEMLLATDDTALVDHLRLAAREVADGVYGKKIFFPLIYYRLYL